MLIRSDHITSRLAVVSYGTITHCRHYVEREATKVVVKYSMVYECNEYDQLLGLMLQTTSFMTLSDGIQCYDQAIIRNSDCRHVLPQCNSSVFKRSFINWCLFML